MSSTIMLFIKATPKETPVFIRSIDQYITSQGYSIINPSNPRIYFTSSHLPPNTIRGLISTIKNTQNYNKIIKTIYYSTNLVKG